MRIFLCLSVLCAAAAFAGELSQHDRDFAVSQMQSTRKMFLDSVAGLTPEQWNFKPAPDRWSIAECAEHIAVSEDFISGYVRNQIVKNAATPDAKSAIGDEAIVAAVPDRTKKFKAPEPIQPTHRWKTPEETVAHFKESRNANIAYVRDTTDDLRAHFAKHPAFGLMDAYQWMLLDSGHSQRHTAQIEEVKADPNFPK
jgi:hypothetical protein